MARGDPPAVPVRGVPQVSSKPLRKTRIQPATRRASGEELDAASAGRAPPPPDRRQLCEGMLRGGFVQSFVDFFYLTHRPDPENEGRDVQVPAREAQYLRENRRRRAARRAARARCTRPTRTSPSTTRAGGRRAASVYFYEKCLEVARLTGDHRGEMAAHHDLGSRAWPRARPRRRRAPAAPGRWPGTGRRARARLSPRLGRLHGAGRGGKAAGAPAVDAPRRAAARGRGGRARGRRGPAFGRAQVASGEPEAAVATLEQAEALLRKLGDVKGEGAGRRAAARGATGRRHRGRRVPLRCLASAAASATSPRRRGRAARSARSRRRRATATGRSSSWRRTSTPRKLATGDADVSTADRARAYRVVRGASGSGPWWGRSAATSRRCSAGSARGPL